MVGKTISKIGSLYREAYSGLSREIWMLSFALFINRLGTMVLPFLTLYLTQSQGYADSAAGLMISVYGVGSVIGAYLGGKLTGPVGSIRLQVILLLISVPIYIWIPFCNSIYELGAAILALSVASEGVRPANATAISEFSSVEQRTRAFALYRMAINLGVSFGPAIGGLLIAVDFFWIFVADAITTGVAALLLWKLFGIGKNTKGKNTKQSVLAQEENAETEKLDPKISGSPARDFEFLLYLGLIFVSALVFFQFYTTYPLYLTERYGLTEFQIGLIYAVNTVLIVIFEMILVEYAKRWKLVLAVAWGSFLTCLGFGILPFSSSIWFCVFSMVVITIGEMLASPMSASWVSQRSENKDTGKYMGWYTMAYAVAFIIGPAIGGFVYEIDPAMVFYLSIIVGFLVLAGFLAIHRRLESQLGVQLEVQTNDAGENSERHGATTEC